MEAPKFISVLSFLIAWAALKVSGVDKTPSMGCATVLTTVRMEVSPVMLYAICKDNQTTGLIVTCGSDSWYEDIVGFCSSFDLNIGQANMRRSLSHPTVTLRLVKSGKTVDAARVAILSSERLMHYRISVWGHQSTRFVLGIAMSCPPEPSPVSEAASSELRQEQLTETSSFTPLISKVHRPQRNSTVDTIRSTTSQKLNDNDDSQVPEYSRPNKLTKSQWNARKETESQYLSQTPGGRKPAKRRFSQADTFNSNLDGYSQPGAKNMEDKIFWSQDVSSDQDEQTTSSEIAKLQWMEDKRILFEEKMKFIRNYQPYSAEYDVVESESLEDTSLYQNEATYPSVLTTTTKSVIKSEFPERRNSVRNLKLNKMKGLGVRMPRTSSIKTETDTFPPPSPSSSPPPAHVPGATLEEDDFPLLPSEKQKLSVDFKRSAEQADNLSIKDVPLPKPGLFKTQPNSTVLNPTLENESTRSTPFTPSAQPSAGVPLFLPFAAPTFSVISSVTAPTSTVVNDVFQSEVIDMRGTLHPSSTRAVLQLITSVPLVFSTAGFHSSSDVMHSRSSLYKTTELSLASSEQPSLSTSDRLSNAAFTPVGAFLQTTKELTLETSPVDVAVTRETVVDTTLSFLSNIQKSSSATFLLKSSLMSSKGAFSSHSWLGPTSLSIEHFTTTSGLVMPTSLVLSTDSDYILPSPTIYRSFFTSSKPSDHPILVSEEEKEIMPSAQGEIPQIFPSKSHDIQQPQSLVSHQAHQTTMSISDGVKETSSVLLPSMTSFTIPPSQPASHHEPTTTLTTSIPSLSSSRPLQSSSLEITKIPTLSLKSSMSVMKTSVEDNLITTSPSSIQTSSPAVDPDSAPNVKTPAKMVKSDNVKANHTSAFPQTSPEPAISITQQIHPASGTTAQIQTSQPSELLMTSEIPPIPNTPLPKDDSTNNNKDKEGIDDDSFWPVVAALVIGIPAVIVFGIAICVIHRRRLPDHSKMFNMKTLHTSSPPSRGSGVRTPSRTPHRTPNRTPNRTPTRQLSTVSTTELPQQPSEC